MAIEGSNIVLMLADDMSFGDLFRSPHPAYSVMQAHFNPIFRTGGMLLSHYKCASSVCSPSRYAIVTGRNPAFDGVYEVIETEDNTLDYIPAENQTIYDFFKSNGYKTAHFGKWHMGRDPSFADLTEYGLDEYAGWGFPLGEPGYNAGTVDNAAVAGTPYSDALALGNDHYIQVRDDLASDSAVDFIERFAATDSLLINVSFHAPHEPLNPDSASLNEVIGLGDGSTVTSAQKYYASIYNLGVMVDKIKDALVAADRWDDTIFIFTADNGGGVSFVPARSDDQWGRPRNYRGQKGEVLDGGITVPFGIRGPGIPMGKESFVATVVGYDLAPTLASMCGFTWTADGDGEDRSEVFYGNDVERQNPCFWISVSEDASTVDAINRGPALRGYFPKAGPNQSDRVSCYCNVDPVTGAAKDVAVYRRGDDPEMINLAHPDVGKAGPYQSEIASVLNWYNSLPSRPLTTTDMGDLSPDEDI